MAPALGRRRGTGGVHWRAGSADLPASAGRIIRYVLSDPSVGRDGHTIARNAWVLDNYRNNPVFLWAHDHGEPPIGRIVELGTVGDRLMGSVEYPEPEIYPFADTIFRLVKEGYLNAASTSWIPLEWQYSQDRARPGGVDFTRVELLEVSQVPVPALPSALVAARAAGINTAPLYDWAERALDRAAGFNSRAQIELLRSAAKMPAVRKSAEPIYLNGASRFISLGEQLGAIARHNRDGGPPDPRLVRAPTGASEADPTGGGFLVQPDFAETLVGSIYEQTEIARRTDRRETSFPGRECLLPAVDETSRADGSRWGGVTSYWAAEAASISSSFPRFRRLAFNTQKIIAIVYGTGELYEDVPMFDAHIRRALSSELGFQLDRCVLTGTGAGQSLGITNATGTISVAKETGQAAATILFENVQNMWSRLPAPCRRRAFWFCNEDVEAALAKMELVVGTSGVSPNVYQPRGANGSADPTLYGRPVIAVEQSPTLGSLGDIVLADPSQYAIVGGPLQAALSADVAFVSDQIIWRFQLRADGKPLWASAITPFNGGATRSPFVTLAARA